MANDNELTDVVVVDSKSMVNVEIAVDPSSIVANIGGGGDDDDQHQQQHEYSLQNSPSSHSGGDLNFENEAVSENEPVEMSSSADDNNSSPFAAVIHSDTYEMDNMIREEQMKVADSLNPSGNSSSSNRTATSSTTAKKRKVAAAPSMSLISFINIVHEIYRDMTFDKSSKEMRFKCSFKMYVDNNLNVDAKQARVDSTTTSMNDPTSSSLNNNSSSNNNNNNTTYSPEFKQHAFKYIVNKLIGYLDKNGMQCLFPKETLKFFLATYTNFITPNDFINTNAVVKTERRSKNTTPLCNGAILQEYIKGFDVFISSMPRSDHNDIRALKFIVENNISLPHSIYDIINKIKFTPPVYNVDTKIEVRPDYSQVVIANAKHMFVLITSDIMLCHDGNQFVTPQTNIEREFSMLVRKSDVLKTGDYILLEVIFATKSKIVDIVQCSLNNNTDLPEKYTDRLEKIKKILTNASIITISQPGTVGDMSYIQKPNVGFGQTFIYHKSHLIAAAVGVSEKTVALAFLEDDTTLVVKSKVSISGAVTCCISTMPFSKSDEQKITIDNVEYKIVGDLSGVRLFERAIRIELRDGNRLGNLSTSSISKVSEYKPIVMRRETSTLMKDIESRLDSGDGEFLTNLIRNISTASLSNNHREILKRLMYPDTSVSFEGYNSLQ